MSNLNISYDDDLAENTIIFKLDQFQPEEIIKIDKTGFYWKGRLIKNDDEIYDKFLMFVNETSSVNIIQLMKQALFFYGDEKNYKTEKNNAFSIIEMDSGENARNILKQIEKINVVNSNIDETYDSLIENTKQLINKLEDEN